MSIGIDRHQFDELAGEYFRRWRVGLCAARPDGAVVFAYRAEGWDEAPHLSVRRLAIEEALRWGEPAVQPAPGETVVWGVPLMYNAKLLGGLVAGISERKLFRRGTILPVIDVRAACTDLRRLAEQHDLTNAALLESRRRESQRERVRAEAIHAYKGSPLYDIRALYLLEEPSLVAAIRKGDRSQARGILNRLLVAMIHRAGARLELVKSFFMELVVTMSRTAVEVGGVPEELLGTNFDSIARLSALKDDEELAVWLHEMLERIMDAIRAGGEQPNEAMLSHALGVMSERCGEHIGRDEAAAAAAMSPSHFSRLFKKHYGRTFNEVLIKMRADRAADLLARTDKPLKIIALECAFADQSHLTKVFRRCYHTTPAQYRIEHKNTKI